MSLPVTLAQISMPGGVGTLPTLLIGLVALAVVILIGRFLLNVAWKIVVLAAIAVGVLWLLGALGLGVV